jgi:Holliday junction resolvasome RuvABC DNA-binding subunit
MAFNERPQSESGKIEAKLIWHHFVKGKSIHIYNFNNKKESSIFDNC